MRKRELVLLCAAIGLLSWMAPASGQAPPHLTVNGSILRGTITMGPTMPVQRLGGPPAIAPVVGARVDIANVDGITVASVTTGADGSYSVPLAPGDYVVTVRPATRMIGRNAPRSVTVTPGAPTALDIMLDTGIR